MSRPIYWTLAVLLFAAMSVGCGVVTPKGVVQAEPLRRVATPVVQRHNDYVQADETLSEETKQPLLADAQAFRQTVQVAETLYAPAWRARVVELTNRHDAYVAADPSLTMTQQRSFLRSTELLRLLFLEAEAQVKRE